MDNLKPVKKRVSYDYTIKIDYMKYLKTHFHGDNPKVKLGEMGSNLDNNIAKERKLYQEHLHQRKMLKEQ